ncbi:hypothetical protein R3P38DRAFT_3368376 [Favolaschia claudopus]|uniref:Uncharacterized protein n=1 Tax=Favolaschia claudopus TaxID=2862362 RepID=A0AAW0A606_9AGAR
MLLHPQIEKFSAARQSSSTSTLQIQIPYFAVRRARLSAFQFSRKFSCRCAGFFIIVNTPNWKFEIRCSRERGFVSRGAQGFFLPMRGSELSSLQSTSNTSNFRQVDDDFVKSTMTKGIFFFAARIT